MEIEVWNNEAYSMIDATTRESISNYVYTFDDIFMEILKEMESNLSHESEVIYSAEYDPVYGFPNIIEIDYVDPMADNDITYTINNFEIVE